VIWILPFGGAGDPPFDALLPGLEAGLGERFQDRVETRPGVPDPYDAWDPARRQHLTRAYHRVLAGLALPVPGHWLGLTGRDLFLPGMSFVFGEADPERRVAVLSSHRIAASPERLAARLLIEAVHELGHTHGLAHCAEARCVMRFSSRIEDSDGKGPDFCARCAVLLAHTP